MDGKSWIFGLNNAILDMTPKECIIRAKLGGWDSSAQILLYRKVNNPEAKVNIQAKGGLEAASVSHSKRKHSEQAATS